MPTVEVTIGRLREQQKRQIAKGIAHTLIEAGIPQTSIRIIFRHIDAHDVAVGDGSFPYWPEEADDPTEARNIQVPPSRPGQEGFAQARRGEGTPLDALADAPPTPSAPE
jgi:phenylpyruvate tautomerase PptA (4-oxalocrotonate tautomerase family)